MPRATIADQTLKLRAIASVAPCNVELTSVIASRLLAEAVDRYPECQSIIELARLPDPREALRGLLINFACPVPVNAAKHPLHDEPALVSNAADLLSLAVYVLNPKRWRVLHELASFFSALIPQEPLRQDAFQKVAPHATALFNAARRGGSGGVNVSYPLV